MRRISPKRNFLNTSSKTKITTLMFWRWGFSDILSNTTRGVLAEFIVARALNLHKEPRLSWESWDLKFKELKIEVNSTAYLQTWNYGKEGKPGFRIEKTRLWDRSKGYSGNKQYNADIYVLCLLAEKDSRKVDPLDLAQWKFWVFSKDEIDVLFGGGKTIKVEVFERQYPQKGFDFKGLKDRILNI